MLELPTDVVRSELGTAELEYAPVRTARSQGDPADIERAANLLLEATSPPL